jgi:hypothetical protein
MGYHAFPAPSSLILRVFRLDVDSHLGRTRDPRRRRNADSTAANT